MVHWHFSDATTVCHRTPLQPDSQGCQQGRYALQVKGQWLFDVPLSDRAFLSVVPRPEGLPQRTFSPYSTCYSAAGIFEGTGEGAAVVAALSYGFSYYQEACSRAETQSMSAWPRMRRARPTRYVMKAGSVRYRL